MSFISYLINGISLGSVYAIIALGYTMVYGIAKMLNFAHGDIIMVGGYAAFISMNSLGVNPILAVILSVVICTILGLVIERVAYRPLRNASSPLAVLITAIGVSYLLQNLALLMFGADTKSFTSVVTVPAVVLAGGKLTISGETIVTVLACMIIMIGLTLFINKTKAGQAMLAVSEDRGAAQLMGINVNGTIALTFAIGSALAAIAAVLLCSAYPSLTPYTGAMPGIKAFVAAVFGGIGSIPGALIGGILLGIIEILGIYFLSDGRCDRIRSSDRCTSGKTKRIAWKADSGESVGGSDEKIKIKQNDKKQSDHIRNRHPRLYHRRSNAGRRSDFQSDEGTFSSALCLCDPGCIVKPCGRYFR